MKRLSTSLLLTAILIGTLSPASWAWGPDARRSIALASMQLLRNDVKEAFRAEGILYEEDMLKGMSDGVEVLRETTPMENDTQVLDAIERQLQLLRAARSDGTGSYFAYRMGVLAALTADAIMPYGIAYSDKDRALKERIDADIDRRVGTYRYAPAGFRAQYIRSPHLYFDKHRPFFADDRMLIKDDYTRGKGYDGFLRNGAKAYYGRAIEAVVNIWFSVFYEGPEAVDRRPSNLITSKYYVHEIGYLLKEKNNPTAASRAYSLFEKAEGANKDDYLTVGDMYYEYGEDLLASGRPDVEALGKEMKERGVHEWKIAQRESGDVRRAASERLSKHFIREGEAYFQNAQSATATETDLADALRSFQQALEFDRTNTTAVARISETSLEIKKKEDRYELQQSFLDKSLQVLREAQQQEVQKNFGDAIKAYNRALVTLGGIDTEFKDLHKSAEENISSIKKFLKTIIQKILDNATDAMEKGQDAQLEKKFDEAVNQFKRVPAILADVPEDAGPVVEESVRRMIDESKELIRDAQSAKDRYERSQTPAPTLPKKN
jgi:tetratricopeptide (TPR) repeat protein